MTVMTEDERIVREAWEIVEKYDTHPTIYVNVVHEFDSWSAARKFTEGRRRNVQKLKEEIVWIGEEFELSDCDYDLNIKRSILSRLEAELTVAKKGMRKEWRGE